MATWANEKRRRLAVRVVQVVQVVRVGLPLLQWRERRVNRSAGETMPSMRRLLLREAAADRALARRKGRRGRRGGRPDDGWRDK